MNKPLFLISGNLYDSRKSMAQVVDYIKKKNNNVEPKIETITCGPTLSSASDVVQIITNQDMFNSGPRIIKVRGLPEDYTDITECLYAVNDSTALVFYGPFGYIKSGSKQFISGKTSNLFKKIKSDGKVIEHPIDAATQTDALARIKELFAIYNKEISGQIARRILEIQGSNLDMLENTVGKISTYQKDKTISLEDVEACCVFNYSDDIWSFIDHLDNRDVDKAFSILESFFREGSGGTGETFYGRIMQLFGALIQHYGFLMLAKDVCPDGVIKAQSIQESALAFKKMTPTDIKKLNSGDMTLDELSVRFSPKFIENNLRKSSLLNVLRRRKGEIYTMISDLYNCMYTSRKYSSVDACLKLYLSAFVLMCCGKLTIEQSYKVRGHGVKRKKK